jgi:hypothetical protein
MFAEIRSQRKRTEEDGEMGERKTSLEGRDARALWLSKCHLYLGGHISQVTGFIGTLFFYEHRIGRGPP